MISNEGIAANLYSLYGGLAERGLVSSGSVGGFDFVRHDGFAWPNMAWRRNPGPVSREEIRALKGSMAAGECPRLVIFGEGLAMEMEGVMAEERLMAATEWVNMALPVGFPEGSGKESLLECREINAGDPDEWSRWASVVSGVLFRNGALDPVLFRSADRKEFTLMTGYADGMPVATCLLYFAEYAALYMVATISSLQGKGIGRALLEHAKVKVASKGYEFVVLHSTKAGLAFYNRLGFKTYGKLFLYYGMP